MKKTRNIVSTILAGVFALLIIMIVGTFTACTPGIVKAVNGYDESLRRANDESNYYTKKEVEDSCRAMIASYESDKLTYLQYKDSDNETKQTWAEEAKMRANKTASQYNNYILKNSYVWNHNIPEDITDNLEVLE